MFVLSFSYLFREKKEKVKNTTKKVEVRKTQGTINGWFKTDTVFYDVYQLEDYCPLTENKKYIKTTKMAVK
jgi:predicted membrane protein